MSMPNGSVTRNLPRRLDNRQASIAAALLVWLAAMPALFGLCIFLSLEVIPAMLVCTFGALAGLAGLAARPFWPSEGGALIACVPFFALGSVGAMASALWASPAWCLIGAGLALGLALRAPLAKLAGLAALAVLSGVLVQAYGALAGLGGEAWLYLSLGGAALTAALVVISFEPDRSTITPTRLFLLDIAPVDRLAVFAALENAWAHGSARAENLQAGRQGACSLRAVRLNGALQVRWCDAPKPAAPALVEARAAFEEREIAELAHEMRTPLHQILGFAEVIEAQMLGPLEANYVEYAGLIGVSGQHLLDLTDSWLERARLQKGARSLDLEEFDLHDLVHGAVRGFAQLAALKRLSLAVEGEACPVRADRRAWRQIIINLLGNALKFSPEGGAVRVSVGQTGALAALTVEDSGPGIAPKDRARILRPFERGTDTAQQDGVGLGLSIVVALLRLHGGELAIQEASLGGALFRASAPIGHTRAVAGLEIEQSGREIPRLEQQP